MTKPIKQLNVFQLLMSLAGALVLLLVLAPLVGMLLNSSGADLFQTVGDAQVRRSILLTLTTSISATLVLSVIAVPFAYLLARQSFPLKQLVLGIIDLPVVIPHSAAGIALLAVLNRDSLAGRMAESLGFSFLGSPLGIAVVMAYVSLPFLINAAREGFAAVPEQLEKAALTLGASSARVFFTIALPLAWRSVLTGLVMMFARGLSEFGAVVIVAYHPMVTPVLIYQRFNDFGLRYARPVAVVFIGICLVVFILLRLLAGGRNHAAD